MNTLGQVLFEMADHVHSSEYLSGLMEKREPVRLYSLHCVEYDIWPQFRFPPTYKGFLLNLHLSFFYFKHRDSLPLNVRIGLTCQRDADVPH